MTDSEGAPAVLVMAHGLGTRLAARTDGSAKTMLEVSGRTILARLLEELGGPSGSTRLRARVRVTHRPDQQDLRRHAIALGATPLVCEPAGYLNDVRRVLPLLGEEADMGVTVVDADLLMPPAELAAFTDLTARPPGDALGMVAVSARPPSSDPRSIRVGIDGNGRALLHDPLDSTKPRTIGLYHWLPEGRRRLVEFVEAGSGSFHRFIEQLAADRAPLNLVEVSEAFNVNTPADLAAAAERVARWDRGTPKFVDG